MIDIVRTEVFGWEAAIRGMRNPMNSWDKSDSGMCACTNCHSCKYKADCESMYKGRYIVGENDLDLMRKLVSAGSDHSKFMRMIHVQCDVTAPRYWWAEYDTYKVGTVANSCSTMHKIADKEFTLDDFSCEHLTDQVIYDCLMVTIEHLNFARNRFNRDKAEISEEKRSAWWQMIQLLPQSYNQKRTIDLNYAVLRNMYHARKCHKLDEWREFCKWIEELPYSELITMKKVSEQDEIAETLRRCAKKDTLTPEDREMLERIASQLDKSENSK